MGHRKKNWCLAVFLTQCNVEIKMNEVFFFFFVNSVYWLLKEKSNSRRSLNCTFWWVSGLFFVLLPFSYFSFNHIIVAVPKRTRKVQTKVFSSNTFFVFFEIKINKSMSWYTPSFTSSSDEMTQYGISMKNKKFHFRLLFLKLVINFMGFQYGASFKFLEVNYHSTYQRLILARDYGRVKTLENIIEQKN